MSPLEKARKTLDNFLSGKKEVPKNAESQDPKDKEIVAYIRNRLEECRTASSRIANESIWLTNIAYLCGFDSVYFDSGSRQFRPMNYPGQFLRKHRVSVNRILPTIQTRLAKLTRSIPRYDVRPNSNDDDDKNAARLGKQILMYLWDKLSINKERFDLLMWAQECGHSWLKVSWDEMAGEQKVYRDENGQFQVQYEGDIRVDICSAFEVFPDPLAKTAKDMRYCIQAKIQPLNYFRDHYENGHLVQAEDCWLTSLQYEARINSFSKDNAGYSNQTEALKNCAIEINYYEPKSKKHPFGRHIITAGGVKLKDDVLPIDEIPLIKFDDILIGGKFNGESTITHLRPLQDQLNRNKTLRAAWTNRLLAGKYLVPRGANLIAEALNDQSGEVVEYDAVPNAAGIQPLQVPTIPEYSYKEDETLITDMNDTSGINEASRGQMPSSSIPAIGMQLLVEQDDTRIGVEVESHEYSYAWLGRILLKFVHDFYVTPRLLKIAGSSLEYTVKSFTGSDLKENFDVHVVRGSTLPGSKVLRRQEILNLYDRGFFGPVGQPEVIDKVMGMLEYGDEFEAWKRHAISSSQIGRGITLIEDHGQKPNVSEYDNHFMWFQKLNELRESEKFEKFDENRQRIVLELMEEHLTYMQEMVSPDSMEDMDMAPDMQPTTAAQEAEIEMMNNAPAGLIEEQNIMQETAPAPETEPVM